MFLKATPVIALKMPEKCASICAGSLPLEIAYVTWARKAIGGWAMVGAVG